MSNIYSLVGNIGTYTKTVRNSASNTLELHYVEGSLVAKIGTIDFDKILPPAIGYTYAAYAYMLPNSEDKTPSGVWDVVIGLIATDTKLQFIMREHPPCSIRLLGIFNTGKVSYSLDDRYNTYNLHISDDDGVGKNKFSIIYNAFTCNVTYGNAPINDRYGNRIILNSYEAGTEIVKRNVTIGLTLLRQFNLDRDKMMRSIRAKINARYVPTNHESLHGQIDIVEYLSPGNIQVHKVGVTVSSGVIPEWLEGLGHSMSAQKWTIYPSGFQRLRYHEIAEPNTHVPTEFKIGCLTFKRTGLLHHVVSVDRELLAELTADVD